MLAAKPNFLIQLWFDAWCRRALRQHFNRLHLFCEAAEEWRSFDPSIPRLYVANHCSFWDGILLNEMLRRHRAQPLYCMIEEPQVRKHPFFRRIGGFSIDRGRPRDIRSAIDYASDLLNGTVRGASRNRNAAALVVFPQGEIQPNDVRPLGFKRGIARILKQAPGTKVIPIALRYEFWIEQRAEGLIWLGKERQFLQSIDRDLVKDLEEAVESGLKILRARGDSFNGSDQILLRGQESISHWKQHRESERQEGIGP